MLITNGSAFLFGNGSVKLSSTSTKAYVCDAVIGIGKYKLEKVSNI